MKTMLACAAALAALVASANAEMRYDRKLEAAIKAKVAENIGDLRNGFDHGDSVEFVQPDPLATVSTPPAKPADKPQSSSAQRRGALTLAVDRKPRRMF